ncbi:MAG: hypothetical protein NTZ56_21800 [Acidobacteria bacterium]|nr:hypothetical protein [Acidobacteriota bacterium]
MERYKVSRLGASVALAYLLLVTLVIWLVFTYSRPANVGYEVILIYYATMPGSLVAGLLLPRAVPAEVHLLIGAALNLFVLYRLFSAFDRHYLERL